MTSFPQYEKIVLNEFYMFTKIYDTTDAYLVSLPQADIESGKKAKLFPLLIEIRENTDLLENECLYTYKDEIGYAILPNLDNDAAASKQFQLIFQVGKDKGHEIVFLPKDARDKYPKLWEQMLRTYFGVFKTVYYVNKIEIESLPC
jgi:hypothetical protein